MRRILEQLAFANVFAPQSVTNGEDKTTSFVDTSGATEVLFALSTAALGAGKTVTVTLMGSAESNGGSPEAIGEAVVFTDQGGHGPPDCPGQLQGGPGEAQIHRPEVPAQRGRGRGLRRDGRSGQPLSARRQQLEPGGLTCP